MNKKDKRSARKWFREILAPRKSVYRPATHELQAIFKKRPEGIEGEGWDFMEFCVSDSFTPCLHRECKGKSFCQVNPLDKSYRTFIKLFGPFEKYEWLCLRLALKL